MTIHFGSCAFCRLQRWRNKYWRRTCFVKEDDAEDCSALSHQFTSHFETRDRSAASVIINGKTITFVRGEDNTIIAMDSHVGAQHGAVVAKAPNQTAEDLLVWLSERLARQ